MFSTKEVLTLHIIMLLFFVCTLLRSKIISIYEWMDLNHKYLYGQTSEMRETKKRQNYTQIFQPLIGPNPKTFWLRFQMVSRNLVYFQAHLYGVAFLNPWNSKFNSKFNLRPWTEQFFAIFWLKFLKPWFLNFWLNFERNFGATVKIGP